MIGFLSIIPLQSRPFLYSLIKLILLTGKLLNRSNLIMIYNPYMSHRSEFKAFRSYIYLRPEIFATFMIGFLCIIPRQSRPFSYSLVKLILLTGILLNRNFLILCYNQSMSHSELGIYKLCVATFDVFDTEGIGDTKSMIGKF